MPHLASVENGVGEECLSTSAKGMAYVYGLEGEGWRSVCQFCVWAVE